MTAIMVAREYFTFTQSDTFYAHQFAYLTAKAYKQHAHIKYLTFKLVTAQVTNVVTH